MNTEDWRTEVTPLSTPKQFSHKIQSYGMYPIGDVLEAKLISATTPPEPLMQEVIFRGTKSFPVGLSLTETVTVDITFVEHKTSQDNHFIEVVGVNHDTFNQMQRIYVSLKTISDLINQEELDKHETVSKMTDKLKNDFAPLSQASMRSLVVQKLLDLLYVNVNSSIDLMPLNTVQLSIPMPEDSLPHELACRYPTWQPVLIIQ